MEKKWQITNARVVTGARTEPAGVVISGGTIEKLLGPAESGADVITLNLHGLHLYPGLINSHDSLMATFPAFAGEGRPYMNWLEHDNEMKSSALFRERMLLDVEQLYLLGAYKNVFAGVTTVVDHIPQFVREPFQDNLPVHLLKDYGIAHSPGSFSLNWGEGITREYQRAAAANRPFILHAGEGFDPESRQAVTLLEKEDGLGEHTVIVHGVSFGDSDLDRVAQAGATIVWCPSANLFLYGKTLRVREAMSRGIPILLGTDSAMCGSTTLLAEMQTARAHYQKTYGEEISGDALFQMVTTVPARVLGLPCGEIAAGRNADLLILKSRHAHPLEGLAAAGPADVFLVVRGGRPVYGDESLEAVFTSLGVTFDRVTVQGTRKLVTSGYRALLDGIGRALGAPKRFDFLPAS